jgi:RNA polymerase sigma factor (sigma-70 family)
VIGRRDPLENPEELIRRVYSFVAYRLGEGHDAEDVTSETFARAVRYRDSYQRGKGEPIAWLIGIARHAIADHVGQAVEIPIPEAVGESPVEPEETWVQALDLRRAVSALEPRDRELIGLRYGADLSARQIADLLEMRTNTVEVALHRALDRLRSLVTDEAPAKGGGSRLRKARRQDAI